MGKILFAPLNTNHVLIFHSILSSLSCDYEFLCHDRISEAEHFHTEEIFKKIGIPYRHFPKIMRRSLPDNLLLKIVNFFKVKREIGKVLEEIKPDVVVLAIDHDPIAQVFIKESKRRGVKTMLIQEGLIRPYEYTTREVYLSDYFYRLLSGFGIYLAYTTKYGTNGCDRILVGGKIASDVLKKRGVPEDKISIVGYPKYDALVERIKNLQPTVNEKKVYLYATSTIILQDDENIRFLKKLADAAKKLGFDLVIKLHPRMPQGPDDVYKVIGSECKQSVRVTKGGDETFEILKKADGFITVSSTMILDALLMDKECLVANYLAGESRLEYGQYDAIHCIEGEEEIEKVIKHSMAKKKSYENKKKLLKDELYELDGKAGLRAAQVIESMI